MLIVRKNIQIPLSPEVIPIGPKIAFLKQKDNYPHPVKNLTFKETQFAWLFLTDKLIYKLKKAVKNALIDMSTRELRLKNCMEELRLNQRLSRNIYHGVVPLRLDAKGKLTFKGDAQIVDWLVQAKRIDETNTLQYAILHNTLNKGDLFRTAAFLIEFYKKAEPVMFDPSVFFERLKKSIETTYAELINPVYALPASLIQTLSSAMLIYMEGHKSLFLDRADKGKIIEVHGDLKPENICMGADSAIINCMELNKDQRIMDMVEELSFLTMECESIGNNSVGEVFFNTYTSLTADYPDESLINFYKLKSAFKRAHSVACEMQESALDTDPGWNGKATRYLQLAEQYYQKLY